MQQPDATLFILTDEETFQWYASDADRHALKDAINDQMAHPTVDHHRVCVLSADYKLLWFN